MCSHSSSTLLSSNFVSAAAEWDWFERLPGMGCKYSFIYKWVIDHDIFILEYYLQGIDRNAKLNDITNAVVQNVNQRCQCGLSAECITEGAFQCFENSDQQVTFRARLCGTAQTNTSLLLAHLKTFVSQTDSTIAVQGVRLDVDSSCPVFIHSFGDPQCTITTTSDSTAAIIGGVVAVI